MPVEPTFAWYEVQVGSISLNGQQIANTQHYGMSILLWHLTSCSVARSSDMDIAGSSMMPNKYADR